jgi:splicing factor 3A subunit 1
MRMAREIRLEAGKAEEAERALDAEDARLIEEGRAAGAPSPSTRQAAEVVTTGDDDEETIRVVKNYKRRKQGALDYDPTKYVVSPLTGELVEINAMAEHMRVSLIDPKWKTQRDAMMAKMKGSAKASDDEISRNLSALAKNRPDVFGDRDALLDALEKEQKGGEEALPETKRQRT